MSKYHVIVKNPQIENIIALTNLVQEIEDVVEELLLKLGLELGMYRIEGLGRTRVDKVEVYIDTDTECYEEMFVRDTFVKLLCKKVTPNINEVYKYIALNLARVAIDILKQFIGKEEEYMIILMEKGAAVLQGTPKEVIAPRIPGTLFTCHTHPKSSRAIFSKRDAKSLIELLSSKGFGSCVVSSISCLTIYRRGPFNLDDYFKLLNIIKEIEYLDINIIKSLNLKSVDSFEIAI